MTQTSTKLPLSNWWILLFGLAAAALSFWLGMWRMQPPAPKSAEAPVQEFSAGRALILAKELLGDGRPHPQGSPANELVRQRLTGRLEALGYEVKVQEGAWCEARYGSSVSCAYLKNVYARLEGQQPGAALVLAAHYDSATSGPGAADNTSNVAVLLETARIFKEHGRYRSPVIFLFPDGEERGLLGARMFMADKALSSNLGAAINLEARGTCGNSMMFETSPGNAWLIEAYAHSVPKPSTNSLMYEAYRQMPNDTDLTVFKEAGIPGMNFAFIGCAQNYHTPNDNLQNLNPGSVQHQGESVLAVAQELAGMELGAAHPVENAIYVDFLGLTLVRWPQSWNMPLALIPLLVVGGLAFFLIKPKRALSFKSLLWGLLAALIMLVLPILLGALLAWVVPLAAGDPVPWFANPLPMRTTLWAGGLFSLALAGRLLARRAGVWGLGLAGWLLWMVLGAVVTFSLPGVGIFFILPALAAALVSGLVGYTSLGEIVLGKRMWLPRAGFILASAIAALFWLPLAVMFENAVGFTMSPAITLGLGLVGLTLLPLLEVEDSSGALKISWRTWMVFGAAVLTLAAAAWAIFTPPYADTLPQPVNILRYQNSDEGKAYYIARPVSGKLPEAMRAAFEPEMRSVYPWNQSQRIVAQAPWLSLDAPGAQVTAENTQGGVRAVTLRLNLAENNDEIELYVPIQNLRSLVVGDQEMPVNAEDSSDGNYILQCTGRDCSGLEVTLNFASAEPQEAFVVSYSYGLPAEDAGMLKLRPAEAGPANFGDLTMVSVKIRF